MLHACRTVRPSSSGWPRHGPSHYIWHTRMARRPHLSTAAVPSDVFVLDFDGVLVDSEPEVSSSAFAAASAYWSQQFHGITPEQQQAIMQGLRRSRPVLVQGFESMVMARLLLEDPQRWRDILSCWPQLLPATLLRWQEDEAALTATFEQHRSSRMNSSDSAQAWLALNQPYRGVRDALAACDAPFYIASSKARHRVARLLSVNFGLQLEPESPRLFCSLLPPNQKKVEALQQIAERPVCAEPTTRLHFVDDRLETMQAVLQAQGACPGLQRYQLYLAEWGYCTKEEVQAARAMAGVRVLALAEFLELIKWGILMGVDDGCEPTPEEVAASV